MRILWPYWAVVIDSFRAALSSRVLWAAMIAIWILLAALSPLGLREDYTTEFRWFDVYNGTRMKGLLAQGLVDPAQSATPLGRIAAELPDELQRKLRRVGEGEEVRIPVVQLSDALNELIENDAQSTGGAANAWFDPDAWKKTVRLRELRELDESSPEKLSDSLLRRRARLRIEAALPGVFEARSPRSVILTYAGLDFPTALPIDRSQFERLFSQFVIPTLIHWLLGFVLVFLGVLVTASIIPEMLQPGSLHLLLSKPISRSGLLLAKFAGGCAFVTLCVAQLVLGLYLISGLRMGIWNPRILWCVPVSVFLFSVFFSVSVPAGLKWRSPIISIAAAGALAAICVVIGVIGGLFEARVVQTDRIGSLCVVGDDWIGVTGGSGLVRWDRPSSRWVALIQGEPMSQDRVLPPLVLDDESILTARIRSGRFSPFGSGAVDLIVMKRSNDWVAQPTLRLPNSTERIWRLPNDQVLAINTGDLLVASQLRIVATAEGEPVDAPEPSSVASGRAATPSLGSFMKSLLTLQGGATEEFTSIASSQLSLAPPVRLAVLERSESVSLVVLAGDRLQLLKPGDNRDGPWTMVKSLELEPSEGVSPPVLAATGDCVVMCRGDGQLRWFDGLLRPRGQMELPGTITPMSMIACSPTNERPLIERFAARTTRGEVRLLSLPVDAKDSVAAWSSALPLSDAESMAFDESSQTLAVAHTVDRLTTFDLTGEGPPKRLEQFSPNLSTWRLVDKYVLGTMKWLTPRVLDLGDTTSAMVSGQDAFVIPSDGGNQTDVVRFQTSGPLISCGVFIVVMLLLSCVLFSRTDY